MRFVPLWMPLTLVLACVLLYSLGLPGVFVFDSTEVLSQNSHLPLGYADFIQWRNAVLSSNTGPSGRPVSMLSFALNSASLGGVSAPGFKLVNLFIHCLTALLAWRALRRLLNTAPGIQLSQRRAQWVALTAASLWLLHPLHVSSVLYAVQRMEQLSALFTLLGVCVYLHYRPLWLQRAASAAELSNCSLLLLIATLLAVFSKEDGVLLLPLLLLVELIFFRFSYNNKPASPTLVRAAGLVIFSPLLIIVGVSVVQPDWLIANYSGREFTLLERLLTQTRVLWQYLAWIFVPDIRPLGLHHDNFAISAGLLQPVSTAVALLGWALLLITSVFSWRRWPLFSFALGWFLIAHLLESSVWPLELVYEHRNYLASLGPCLLLSWLLWCTLPAVKRRPRAVLAALLLLLMSVQLGTRTSLWADEEQLAAYHLYHHPDSLRSVYHYANTQLRLGEAAVDPDIAARRLTLARQYYEDMLRPDPSDMSALATLLYLDSRYFSSLASARWIGELKRLSTHHNMRRNDKAGLGVWLDCLVQRWCDQSGLDYVQTLQTLAARYPETPLYLDFLARYFGLVEQDYAQAIQFHQQLLVSHPDYSAALEGLVVWHNHKGSRDLMIESIGNLLRVHSDPAQVQRIKKMLETGTR